jgi:uncharacterized damage-inducible protein DinB
MNPDFTSNTDWSNPRFGGTRAKAERESYLPSLEFHRTTRAQTLEMAQTLSQRQMDYQAEAGKWSVGEVLDHLILGERLNLSYIAEVIGLKEAGQRPVLRLSFTDVDVSVAYLPKSMLPTLEVPLKVMNMFLPSRARDFLTRYRLVPAQSAEITTPRRGRLAGELRGDLISSLKEMEVLLDSHHHLDFSEMIVEHPLLGNNNISDLLRFLALHEQRHQSQIESVLRSPGFPASA